MFPIKTMNETQLMRARALARKLRWTKSSPNGKYKDTPHEYAWRAKQLWNEPYQKELAMMIEEYGVAEPFFRTFFNYLYLGDGYKYWLCGTVAENNFLITRADERKSYGGKVSNNGD